MRYIPETYFYSAAKFYYTTRPTRLLLYTNCCGTRFYTSANSRVQPISIAIGPLRVGSSTITRYLDIHICCDMHGFLRAASEIVIRGENIRYCVGEGEAEAEAYNSA